jgi:phosphorylcholine metabolism protein LicD
MGHLRSNKKLTPDEQKIADFQKFQLLCKIKDCCDRHNVKWSLGWGTLLGVIRDENFIPNDSDCDVNIHIDTTTEAWFNEIQTFTRRGLEIAGWKKMKKDKFYSPLDVVKVGTEKDPKGNEIYCDLYFFYPINQTGSHGAVVQEFFHRLWFPENIWLEPLKSREFMGVNFPIPIDHDGYLEWAYGPNWRIKDEKWTWSNKTSPLYAPNHFKNYRYNWVTKQYKFVIK